MADAKKKNITKMIYDMYDRATYQKLYTSLEEWMMELPEPINNFEPILIPRGAPRALSTFVKDYTRYENRALQNADKMEVALTIDEVRIRHSWEEIKHILKDSGHQDHTWLLRQVEREKSEKPVTHARDDSYLKKVVGKYLGFELSGRVIGKDGKRSSAAAKFDHMMALAYGAWSAKTILGAGVFAIVPRWRCVWNPLGRGSTAHY